MTWEHIAVSAVVLAALLAAITLIRTIKVKK
jgi:hypothetical protein